MDNDRQMRFLIPPFVLLASLLLGAALDKDDVVLEELAGLSSTAGFADIVPLILAGGVALVAVGFLLSNVTIAILRLLFWVRGDDYEALVPSAALDKAAKAIGLEDLRKASRKADALYILAIYGHYLVPQKVHDWIHRRWNAFMVTANSACALVLSFIVGEFLGITILPAWIGPGLVVLAVLLFNAALAWRQTMGMLGFLPEFEIKHPPKLSP